MIYGQEVWFKSLMYGGLSLDIIGPVDINVCQEHEKVAAEFHARPLPPLYRAPATVLPLRNWNQSMTMKKQAVPTGPDLESITIDWVWANHYLCFLDPHHLDVWHRLLDHHPVPGKKCRCSGHTPPPSMEGEAAKMLQTPLAEGLMSDTWCPVCGSQTSVYLQVIHLNDTHQRTREYIADWLDSICEENGINLTFPVPEEAS